MNEVPTRYLKDLLPFTKRLTLAAHKDLYCAGTALNYLYFPETAVISEIGLMEDGRMIETTMLGRETAPGLSAVLSDKATNCGARVLVGGTALQIKASSFRHLFRQSDALQTISLDYLNRYIKQVLQNLLCRTYHSAEQRFCYWLLMLHAKNEQILFSLTQELIADCLGIQRPTLSQAAGKLQKERIIQNIRGKISILSIERLQELSCECCKDTNH